MSSSMTAKPIFMSLIHLFEEHEIPLISILKEDRGSKVCLSLEELQADLNAWLKEYKRNTGPIHGILLWEKPFRSSQMFFPWPGKR